MIAFTWDTEGGTFEEFQTVRTLPPGYEGRNLPADIHITPDGRFLYASNRGHDSIAVFSVDPAKGTLTPVEITPTQGRTPRNFVIDPSGQYLLAENSDTDTIVVFRIDQASGKLTPTGDKVDSPVPVCIRFLAVK